MAKKPARRYIRSARKTEAKPKVTDATKKMVEMRCNDLVESFFRPKYVRTDTDNAQFSYIVDLHTKWYRNYFHFGTTYRCPAENCISEFFDTKYARLEYRSEDQYHLSYMRHTEQWFVVHYDLSLEECLQIIQDNEIFHPV